MRRGLALLAAVLLSVPMAALADRPECRAPRALLDLGHPLDVARAGMAEQHELRIVAMDSSSTQGFGASNPMFAYPAQLKMILDEALPA